MKVCKFYRIILVFESKQVIFSRCTKLSQQILGDIFPGVITAAGGNTSAKFVQEIARETALGEAPYTGAMKSIMLLRNLPNNGYCDFP
jgi:hypothetical protein